LDKQVHQKDFELLRPTLRAGGKFVFDCGHLKNLEDSEIRKIASKYDDPDEFLKIRWVPLNTRATNRIDKPACSMPLLTSASALRTLLSRQTLPARFLTGCN
jgi:hypothetical protein